VTKPTVIVLLSGGLDSTVLLGDCIERGYHARALTVNYGQRHVQETTAAWAVAQHYGVEWQYLDLTVLRGVLAGSSQTSADVAVPHGHYADETMRATVVPNRNMILLAIAGAWAVSVKATAIAYAAHSGDHPVYPDCRPAFIDTMAEALRLADWHQVDLLRPFTVLDKAAIVARGHELHAPLGLTYSCYEGRRQHCGRCGTCVERHEAFVLAGVVDPTAYELQEIA